MSLTAIVKSFVPEVVWAAGHMFRRPTHIVRRISRRIGRLRHPEAKLSFAQEAEDLVLLRHLELPTNRVPFYVDVGAHDPKWISNTCLLYLSGWNGINIDA